ncbi:FAD-dependent monooxygenase [Mesorhizobium sp. CAU 1732]|uniref:FAD-dependent monooxygenase n=1 Tax=Mesorhizobium sp. CAU 1732 TaxID=3140358 RepID=UPI003260A014
MTANSGRIAIAGAGIAGLTAAIAFAAHGRRVTVFERSTSLDELGAGIQLSPNATRILARLGVLPHLLPIAVRPEAIEIRRADTMRLIASVPLGDAAERRWAAPYLTVHRADLQSALLAVATQNPNIDIVTGASVTDADFEGQGVTLSVERDGQTGPVACDLAVGADGVWSTLRRLGRSKTGHYTGNLAWRAMIRTDDHAGIDLPPMDRVTTVVAKNFHLVAYPVRSGSALNLVAVTRGPDAPERWSTMGDRELLLAAMKGSSPDVLRLVDMAGQWTTWPIHQVAVDGPWTNAAGFALIGDAAHAMPPYAAQGAAMAIEDADTLATAIARWPGDTAAALIAFEKLRRRRIIKVSARGAFNKFAWHASGPVAMVRDRVLKSRGPEKLAADLDWLYGWDIETELGKL